LEVWDDDFSPAYNAASRGTQAALDIANITQGKGRKTGADKGGTDRTLRNTCWECLGRKKHDDPYKYLKNNEETGESQVTSWFTNERHKKYGKRSDNMDETVTGLYKQAIQRYPAYAIELEEAHAIALANPILAKAADWVCQIGHNIVM